MEIKIEDLRILCKEGKIKWSMHSLKRMKERQISYKDYKNCIMTGEIIEQCPNDRPLPSCLVLGKTIDNKPLHDIAGSDNEFIYAITAYYPNLLEWENEYRTRKEN